jgi:hypothetical protein
MLAETIGVCVNSFTNRDINAQFVRSVTIRIPRRIAPLTLSDYNIIKTKLYWCEQQLIELN